MNADASSSHNLSLEHTWWNSSPPETLNRKIDECKVSPISELPRQSVSSVRDWSLGRYNDGFYSRNLVFQPPRTRLKDKFRWKLLLFIVIIVYFIRPPFVNRCVGKKIQYTVIQYKTVFPYNSSTNITSVALSYVSYNDIIFGWPPISFKIFTSRSISERFAPRLEPIKRRFFINFAAYSTPVTRWTQRRTVANWPL